MDAFRLPKGWTKDNISNNKSSETQYLLKPPFRVPQLLQEVELNYHDIAPKRQPVDEKPQIELLPPKSEVKTYFKSIKIYLTDDKRVCEVCRVCFCAIQDTDMIKLAQESNEDVTQLKNMLKQVLPDLDLNIYQNSVVCKKCKDLLVASFELRTTWLATEEKLRAIIENQKGDPEKSLMLVAGTVKKKAPKSIPQKTSILEELLTKTMDPDLSKEPLLINKESEKTKVQKRRKKILKKISKKCENCLCEQCGRFLSNNRSLKRHQESHLKTVEKQALQHSPSICDVCGLMCPTLIILRKHMYIKHRKKPPIEYKCTICKRNFCSKAYYQEHVRRLHMKTNNYLQCHLCGKKLAWKTSLRYHLKTHEGQKMNTCKICNKKFFWKTGLKRHMLKHSNTMLSCEFCGKNIKYEESLKRHIMVYHMKEGKTNCDVCGKRFINKKNLIIHKIKIHGWTHSQQNSD